MKRIIGIKFSHYGQIYFFYCEDPFVGRGDRVLAETGQGLGIATVMNIVDRLPEDLPPDGVRDVLRKVTDEDQIVAEENDTLTYSAHKFCESRIRERQLDMKLVDVEVLFDRSKLVFYFTAPTRIDFRELVKDLVREYHTRIELRQIGVRHETQMLRHGVLLPPVPAQVCARDHQDGEGAEPVPEPLQDFGHLRAPLVLPQL